jgi:DamX protein
LANTLLNHQLPILLVDDAHLLPLASLKVLVELALLGEPQSRLRIALFCEPQITSILAAPEFQLVQKTLIHTLDIPPLSQAQVREYLHFHLEGTSLANHHPFDMETLRVLYQESEGVFGKINQLARQPINNFLQQQVGTQLPQPNIKRSLLLLGMASVLAGSALLAYTYSPEMFIPQNPAPKPEPIISMSPAEVKEVKAVVVEKVSPKSVEKPPVPEKPVEKVEANPLAVLLGKPELKSNEWLLAQSPQAYTIQIMGLHDLQAFKKLLGTENSANMIVFKTEYQKKEWYVLLFGIYPSQEQATVALHTLPESFRMSGTQPWVRSVAGVQQSLLKPR